MPWGEVRLSRYSKETHAAGKASNALHQAPRRSSARKSNTASANTSARMRKIARPIGERRTQQSR